MSIKELYRIFLDFPFITTDSRKVVKDSLFFALRGEQFDGNKYAGQALERGCSFAVVDDKDTIADDRYIFVNDTLETLQRLAEYHREQLDIKLIAITGSNGKTTTKELVTGILAKKFKLISTQGNLNNHIGVPLTLLQMKQDTQIAVIEMGANHCGEIAYLCKIAKPTYGLITNIGHAHIEGFGSYANIIEAKAELYEWIRKNNGIIFQNSENPVLHGISNTADNIISYGTRVDDKNNFSVINADPTLEILWKYRKEEIVLNTNLFGTYNIENIMAAIAIGIYFGVEPYLIKNAIESYKPQNNRSQIKKTTENLLILDAYNANPTSIMASINDFLNISGLNKIMFLGDMYELGKESENEHKKIVEFIKDKNVLKIYLIGKDFSKAAGNTSFTCFDNIDECIKHIIANPIKTSTILLKGSRMMNLERLIPYL